MIRITSVSGSIFCKCGAYLNLTAHPSAYDLVMQAFSSEHTGEGHWPTTKADCRKARRRHVQRAVEPDGVRE